MTPEKTPEGLRNSQCEKRNRSAAKSPCLGAKFRQKSTGVKNDTVGPKNNARVTFVAFLELHVLRHGQKVPTVGSLLRLR